MSGKTQKKGQIWSNHHGWNKFASTTTIWSISSSGAAFCAVLSSLLVGKDTSLPLNFGSLNVSEQFPCCLMDSMGWIWVEMNLKDHPVPIPFQGQGNLPLDCVALSPIPSNFMLQLPVSHHPIWPFWELGRSIPQNPLSPFFFSCRIFSTALKSTCGYSKDFCHAQLWWISLWNLYFVGHISGNAGRSLMAAGKFQAPGLLFYPKCQHSNNSSSGSNFLCASAYKQVLTE